MSKSRKSLSTPWVLCEKCQSTISQKDTSSHESECPPPDDNWGHSYIKNSVLYSAVDTYCSKEPPKNLTERDLHDLVFMSHSAFELCQIAIGSQVILTFKTDEIVKTAWPTSEKSITSVCLTQKAMKISQVSGPVKVKKLHQPLLAKEIAIEYIKKESRPKLTPELQVMLRNFNGRKVFCVGNRIHIPYYGKNLLFKIVNIIQDRDENSELNDSSSDLANKLDNMSIEESGSKFFLAEFTTKWTVVNESDSDLAVKENSKITSADIGGYHKLLDKLRDIFNLVLNGKKALKSIRGNKGILLCGAAGVGKSTIANAILSEYHVNIFLLNSRDIHSKYSNEGSQKLVDLFTKAKAQAPSVIFIEDIDTLCPKKGSSEAEKALLETLIQEIDYLQESNLSTLLLTTSSKLDSIDSLLRRDDRLGYEIEIPTPTPHMRCEILKKLLSKIPNNVTDDELNEIGFVTHGFVATNLRTICSRAAFSANKRHKVSNIDSDGTISASDLYVALTDVKPSAMKDIFVQVPNVKWSDIGGQESLKKELRQAVELPLKHPEAFLRSNIKPSKGVLMYGPPGCSKTMIAKALATESKLNFINIKGPELFSKWVGESERSVREVFRRARQVAPSIVFIDEIDAMGGGRSSDNGGNDVQERVLTQLLTELDGVIELENVLLLAATNRPDRLDEALLRPGRFDKTIKVPLPDSQTREEIFKIKFKKMPIDENVVINDLVERTEGYSGAEIQAVCQEAVMSAIDENLDYETITKDHFEYGLKKVKPRTVAKLLKLYDDFENNK
ncbi:ribosome biogenesis protein SPATA5 [Microplitis mediator]|uniref:ribosome biogenesis protein SPATA5 n=1 Tax=Microplitis mediator TaxID=375433 RepID=UPI002557A7FF|nr:ribosome biogenesis protein SPATA5 [Microplitis mediator]